MTITVCNRQRKVPVELAALQDFAERAVKQVLKLRTTKANVLATLREVSVVLVSDRRIAELHRRFINQPGPTDVITFQHGEIFVSTETARRQARSFATSFERELRLYIAHGLLHLQGFDDKDAHAAAEMKRTQEKLVSTLLYRRSMTADALSLQEGRAG